MNKRDTSFINNIYEGFISYSYAPVHHNYANLSVESHLTFI